MSGSLVYRVEQSTEKGIPAEFYIDGSSLDRGVYLMKLWTDGEQIIRRISKL